MNSWRHGISATAKRLIIRSIPPIVWDLYRKYTYQRRSQAADVATTFNKIYSENFWQDKSSTSGSGSNLVQTSEIRRLIPDLLTRHNIRTMLDIPCGDFYWVKEMDLGSVRYTGADIVPDLIESNNKRFSTQNISFQTLNLITDRLTCVDLILCRDCLVHFSYEHAAQAIRNIRESGSRYLLTTSFVKRRLNFDIRTGDWRPINLQIRPYYFPKPVDSIHERCTEGNGKSFDKSLLLYSIADLPDKISNG